MADCIKDTGYLAEFSNVDFRQLPTRQKGITSANVTSLLNGSLFNFTNRTSAGTTVGSDIGLI